MVLIRFILLLGVMLAGASPLCAEKPSAAPVTNSEAKADASHEKAASHGLTPHAVQLWKVGPLIITNSMVVCWAVALTLILVAQLATRNITPVPGGLQNFCEWLIEGLYDFFAGIVGRHLIGKSFWFFCTIFLFILASNWIGLIPGVGTIGWGHQGDHGFVVEQPLLRGVNADLNMTLSMAALFMVLWMVWALQTNGIGGFVGHIFNVKGHGGGVLGTFLVVVFIFVGMIEIVSISVRPVALTFRLYGNIFAGENILETVMHMGGPWFGWLAALPFYLLEVLVGLVQALVFALLTSVFTALICEHHHDAQAKH